VEKSRYITALKALVHQKALKFNPQNQEIPNLCSCGAMAENLKQTSEST